MSPKCELHDEIMEGIHDSLKEIKDRLEKGSDQFTGLEKSKLSWKTFTLILTLLMGAWLATQGVIWTEVKSVGQRVINLDKKVAVHVGMDTDDK